MRDLLPIEHYWTIKNPDNVFKSHGLASVFRVRKPQNGGGEESRKLTDCSGSDACWGQVQSMDFSSGVNNYVSSEPSL